jgi:hypothetical protein
LSGPWSFFSRRTTLRAPGNYHSHGFIGGVVARDQVRPVRIPGFERAPVSGREANLVR